MGIQLRNDFVGVDPARQADLDFDGVGGEIVDRADLDLALLGRIFDRSDQTL